MSATINAMREAESELDKLLALRNGVRRIAPYGDSAAIDHLSDMAIDVHDLGADAVQGAINEGIRASEQPQPKPNGNGNGAHKAEGAQAPPPFAYVDIAIETIPGRKWAVEPERIPAAAVTLFSGHGAIGKSLLILQLCAAAVLGRDWITMLPERGPAFYFSAEEDADEICRRLETIARALGVTRADLRDAGLWVVSRAGADAILAVPDRSGVVKPTPMFNQLRTDVLNARPKLIVIDTAADVFAGNEIDRSQTRQFITLLRGLAMETGAAVILLAHPSLIGISSGTGLSGSTAWHNSVRARMYLAAVTGDDDDDESAASSELRKLQFVKNNYGRSGDTVVLRWRDGLFAPETQGGSLNATVAAAKAEDVFISLLRRFAIEGRTVSHNRSNNYAPSIFAREAGSKAAGVNAKLLVSAMARLFEAGRLKVMTQGNNSHRRSWLVEVDQRHAADDQPRLI
jgi:hypothetical protein